MFTINMTDNKQNTPACMQPVIYYYYFDNPTIVNNIVYTYFQSLYFTAIQSPHRFIISTIDFWAKAT